MGLRPECEAIIIDIDCQFKVHLQNSRIFKILTAFAELLPQLLMDFFQKVLVGLANIQWLPCKSILPASAAMMRNSCGKPGMESKRRSMGFIVGWNCINYKCNVLALREHDVHST